MLCGRKAHSMCNDGKLLYILGGIQDKKGRGTVPAMKMEMFNPRRNQFTDLALSEATITKMLHNSCLLEGTDLCNMWLGSGNKGGNT